MPDYFLYNYLIVPVPFWKLVTKRIFIWPTIWPNRKYSRGSFLLNKKKKNLRKKPLRRRRTIYYSAESKAVKVSAASQLGFDKNDKGAPAVRFIRLSRGGPNPNGLTSNSTLIGFFPFELADRLIDWICQNSRGLNGSNFLSFSRRRKRKIWTNSPTV